MASKVDWKQKYFELRSKYMQAVDVAFRLGMQEGQKAAELENMQMQMQQMQEEAAMQAQMGGMPGEEPMMEEEMPPEEMMAEEEMGEEEMGEEEMGEEGDELGDSMDELEGMVAKGESEVDFTSVMKKFHQLENSEGLDKDEQKSKKVKKINTILEKWDDDSSEETDNGDPIGQA
jgi:hypothetical protein